ncbi:MAG: septal ring lytic transglycosylase RlpA family protein [Gammaproteobacteria bacterium]|nr:septal ring lytic transglycosylase RlpA family protein [Gammaproteobacteria bacterium]
MNAKVFRGPSDTTLHAAKCSVKTFYFPITLGATLLLLLSACSGPLPRTGSTGQSNDQDSAPDSAQMAQIDVDQIPDAIQQAEPLSKYGNPETYAVYGQPYRILKSSTGFVERGISSWYGTKFHGKRTSSGEPYNMYTMTAAHKTLPIPCYVEVTNLRNGRKIVVRVNDRGPFHEGRIIDLSYVAALKLGITKTGTGDVEIRTVEPAGATPATVMANADVEIALVPAPTTTTPEPPAQLETAAATPAPPSVNMYLQVGAFSSRLNAENLRNQLIMLAPLPIQVTESNHLPQTFYRVRIGPLTNEVEVEQLATKLAAIGITKTKVIAD